MTMCSSKQSSENEVISKYLLWVILLICLIISIGFAVLFLQNREWNKLVFTE